MRKLVQAVLVVLRCVHGLLAANDVTCVENRALLEVPGDAVVTVFIDINEGPYCNETTQRGLQKMSTAVHVVRILNKYNYVPDMSIGLRIFDTCHDEVVVYKQAITALTALDCTINYELSILASESYSKVLRPFVNYSLLQINYYHETNLSVPLIESTLRYVGSKFQVIDLLLSSADVPSNKILHLAQQTGICVRNHQNIAELEALSDIVVFAVGYWSDLQTWFEMLHQNHKPTWIVISLDNYYDFDTLPIGTYYIQSEPLDDEFSDETSELHNYYLNMTKQTIVHSPYLLNLGRSIGQIVKPLRSISKSPRSHPEDISIDELYDILHIGQDSQFIRYWILKKIQRQATKTSSFKLYQPNWISTEVWQKLPGLCLENTESCEGCVNFKKDPVELRTQLLRSTEWVPIYLTIAYCGTFACIIIGVFIIHRYLTEQILEGNPALTILLVLANIFLLQTVFPFCMDEQFAGSEYLNSRKIFLTTLSFGLLFSIILSRALFLAFSTGSMLTAHINGYLQSFMILFMAGVQLTISTMYFVLSSSDSAAVIRSLMFIALLSYDIFLLLVLFIICCFICQLKRNYREGKCFFATVIGLLVVWAIWLTCFILVEPQVRDIIVCFGIVATGLFVIIGILVPRTYYMVTHLRSRSIVRSRFNPADFVVDPRINTSARQYQQPFYEYIRPVDDMPSAAFSTSLPLDNCSNYYGTTSSPSSRYFERTRLSEPRTSAYTNYGFHSEMRELENAYVVPRVCVQNPQGFKTQLTNSEATASRAQTHQPRKPKFLLRDKDCIETDIYVEDKRLPPPSRRGPNENYPSRCCSPKLDHVDATITEEDEYEESFLSTTTKF